ncbi:MAG: ABC transporter permease [Gemmatimonadota bacterium]
MIGSDEPDGVDEELRHHLESRARRLVQEGWSLEEARVEARRRFGDAGAVRAAVRREDRIGRWTMMWRRGVEGLWMDVRVGARQWTRTPGVTIVALLTLALGIGATTAIFSLVDGILLRPLPFPEPERLVAVWSDWTERGGPEREWFGYANLHDIRTETASLEEVGIYGGWGPTLLGRGDPVRVDGIQVTAGTLGEVFRVEPALGRLFLDEEDVPGGPAVVVVSHGFWTERLGADPGAVGQTLDLGGASWEVIGVLPPGFRAPLPYDPQIWGLLQLDAAERAGMRGNASFRAFGRLAPGVSLTAAQSELSALASRLEEAYPEHNTDMGFLVVGLRDDLVASARSGLSLVLAAVALVLLLACVNVANLLLARNSTREGAFAVRAALGSGRSRVVRQLLVETGLLTVVGGALGVALGVAGTRILVAMAPPGTPRIDAVSVDGRVLAVALGVTVAAAVMTGLLPALKMGRADLRSTLAGGGRGASSSGTKLRLRSTLVVLQVGLAVALLATAGVLGRSFSELRAVDLGFRPEGVASFFLGLQGPAYDAPEARAAFFRELLPRLGALPGVEAVGGVSSLPLSGFDGDVTVQAEEAPIPPPGQRRAAWVRRATPDYMETLGLRLVAGRGIEDRDGMDTPPVAVINQTLAARHFPEVDPIGRRLAVGDPDDPLLLEIVGVVADVRNFGVRDDFRAAFYVAHAQSPSRSMFVALRTGTGTDPAALAPAIRSVVGELDSDLAVPDVQLLTESVAEALGPDRFLALLLAGFAGLALVLAVVGLYGVVSYAVGARVREVGVRIALGADAGTIRSQVILQSLVPVAVGVGLGLILAWVGSRFTAALLYRVSPVDPMSLAGTVAVLLLAGLAAAAIPAFRAARTDPMTVLREE